jgi:hypothetical protein
MKLELPEVVFPVNRSGGSVWQWQEVVNRLNETLLA